MQSLRTAEVSRKTQETAIDVRINLDGTGRSEIDTGIGFLDHMLDQIARHGLVDLTISAKGDLQVDGHHTVEDIGITLGQALLQALGDKRGIRRYGSAAYDLCCVAAGFLDGYWELALHVWDVCAGELIVREAGGAVRSLREDRGVSIVAGNETLIGEMLQYVR